MLFNSFVFAGIFLPLSLLLFWSLKSARHQRGVLLASSLIFYAYWMPPYIFLLIGLVAIAWACALLVEKTRAVWPLLVAASALFGALAYYKYAGFLTKLILDLGLGAPDFRASSIVLPLGISFIVFQAMGYVVDVYRGEFPAEKRFSVVLLFKAFFPQLIAGPICRAHELMPQIKGHFHFRAEQFTSGLAIFALGLLLKEAFADSLAPSVNTLFAIPDDQLTIYSAWAGSIGFGGQIYADFWGYSTMAVGLARMFSIDIPVNFNLPYFATSLRDFWRRWHITLSQWLRDYLYKPLGGSWHGRARTMAALMATMLLGGLWHGANYTFVVWGAIHATALVIEHFFLKKPPATGPFLHRLRSVLGWIYTLTIVSVAWVYFRATDMHQANTMVSAMFSLTYPGREWTPQVIQVASISLALFILQVPAEYTLDKLQHEKIAPHTSLAIAFWAVIAAIVLGAPEAVPFIYFQF